MVDYTKQDMSLIWAELGDYTAPLDAKITEGWLVEVPPRQYWNWLENRQDKMLAYLAQKGLPEWDATTEYITNKSFVQKGGISYKCILTNTNQDPATEATYWVRAFSTWSQVGDAVGGLTPAADTYIYFTSPTTATTATITAFARSILDDVDAAAVRTTISAQPLDATLTSLAGLTTAANKLPYFTGVDTADVTDLTAFGRSLIDDADASAARTTLGVSSTTDVNAALATKQPLDATLTAMAGVTTAVNKIIYFNGVDTATSTDLSAFGRTLIDDADAATARTTLDVPSTGDVAAALAGKQPLDATLTAVAGTTTAANKLIYFTGTDTTATTDLSSYGRSLIDDADAAAARTTLGLENSATIAATVLGTADTIALRTSSGGIVATALEVGRVDGVAAASVVDMHSGATAVDYDARILCTGGTGTIGQAGLALHAGNITVASAVGATVLQHAGATKLTTNGSGVTIAGTVSYDSLGVGAAAVNIDNLTANGVITQITASTTGTFLGLQNKSGTMITYTDGTYRSQIHTQNDGIMWVRNYNSGWSTWTILVKGDNSALVNSVSFNGSGGIGILKNNGATVGRTSTGVYTISGVFGTLIANAPVVAMTVTGGRVTLTSAANGTSATISTFGFNNTTATDMSYVCAMFCVQ